ncbi:MAG: molybdopterin-binding oxidoreductase [Caulobacterales bacterium]|nr:molybdopterin-binding oxidoreductase [Caulobacterales bacterium]
MKSTPRSCRRLIPLVVSLAAGLVVACSPASSATPDVPIDPDVHAPQAAAQVPVETLTLTGADASRVVLTRDDLAALPRERVTFSRHEDTSVYEGPLLLDVLARVGVPGSPLPKDQQATALLITVADGYQVVLGLAETDPATRADRIIVADTDDGEPLGPDVGPFMIVAEGDARAARSARMVVAIQVIPLGGATN